MSTTKLPEDVIQHRDHGQKYFEEGKCVTCGGEKEDKQAYHCEKCYAAIFPAIMDYDDD